MRMGARIMPVKQTRFKLTHRNIRARYLLQKEFDPSFSLEMMAQKFGVHKMAAYKWCRVITDGEGKEVPDPTRAPLPSGRRKIAIMEWINDGALARALERGKQK